MPDTGNSLGDHSSQRHERSTWPRWAHVVATLFAGSAIGSVPYVGIPMGVLLTAVGALSLAGRLPLTAAPHFAWRTLAVGGIAVLAGLLPKEPGHSYTAARRQASPRALVTQKQPGIPSESRSSDAWLTFVPTELAPFVLVETREHPKRLAGIELPQAGVLAKYLASEDVGVTADLLVTRSSEALPAGRPVKIDGATGVMTERDDQVAVLWRHGEFVATLWLRPASKAKRSAAKNLAVPIAASVQARMQDATRLDPAAQHLRAEAVRAALASKQSQAMAGDDKLKRVLGRVLPSIETASIVSDELTATAAPGWEALPAAQREAQARLTWKMWASINSPDDVDRSTIRIVARSGRVLAASGIAGGSSISLR